MRNSWLRVREFLRLRLFDEFAYDLLELLKQGHDLPEPPKTFLVDEYQDLTPVELELIRTVAVNYDVGAFACGDDRQSIYGFREADPLALNNFASVYGIGEPAYLSQSYRCPEAVLRLAEEVAARMPVVPGLSERPAMTSGPDLGEGNVRIATFKSFQAEARWIACEVQRLRGQGDRAVIVARFVGLYVTEMNRASEAAGLTATFRDSRSPDPAQDDPAFRLAYALARLAVDIDDELAWRTVLHVSRKIKPARYLRMYSDYERWSVALRAEASLDKATRLVVESVEEARAALALAQDAGAAKAAIEVAADALGLTTAVLWDAIQAALGDDPDAAHESPLQELLAGCRALGQRTAAEEVGENEVLVYTVHAAKGQQWDHVFLGGAYEQAFLDQAPADGLRRLYVALTRAKQSIAVTVPRSMRYTQLEHGLGTRTTRFLPQFTEAAGAAGVEIEKDPTAACD